MNFNHQKLKDLEARAERLRDLSNGLDNRFYADRVAVEEAERELQSQRKGRRHLGGGVPNLYLRRLTEERETLEKTTRERTEVSESLKKARALVTRCHEYLRDVHGLDLNIANQPLDSLIVFGPGEAAQRKRALGIPGRIKNAYLADIDDHTREDL